MSKRQVYFINPEHRAEGGYIPCLVTEGEPGYKLMSGREPTQAPWVWGPDYETAVATAEKQNERRGFDKAAALKIVAENMGLSRTAEQVASTVIEGLTEYHAALSDETTAEQIRRHLFAAYRETGNAQADYERLRDEAERLLKTVSAFVGQ